MGISPPWIHLLGRVMPRVHRPMAIIFLLINISLIWCRTCALLSGSVPTYLKRRYESSKCRYIHQSVFFFCRQSKLSHNKNNPGPENGENEMNETAGKTKEVNIAS